MGLETFPGPFPKIPIFVTRGPAERCPTRRSRRRSGRCQTPRYPPLDAPVTFQQPPPGAWHAH